MSVTRNYFGERGRDRQFNYRRNDRGFIGNIPTSRHSIFIRGFPASISTKHVKNFFVDETRSTVEIDFVSYTDDHKKLCVAVRFESNQVAREVFSKYNNREILGHIVEFSWFKDMKAVKGKLQDRRFRGSYGGGNRGGNRRFNDRRSRSKPRHRDSVEKRRDYKSHSRSRDSQSSSSYSKSRSGSDSPSDRSSASQTRKINNKEKYKRRHTSVDSYSSSKERNETKSDDDNDKKKRKRKSRSRKVSEEVDKKSIKKDEHNQSAAPAVLSESDSSKVELRLTELLEAYSGDIEKYLNIVNVLIGKHNDFEAPLVESLKDILEDLGDKYVQQLVNYIADVPNIKEISAN